MLENLLNVTIKVLDSETEFNGLGQEEILKSVKETIRSRHRRLTSREQYVSKGNDETITDRFYVMGSRKDHPFITSFGIIQDEEENLYAIQSIVQGQTLSAHHLEIDCITYKGA